MFRNLFNKSHRPTIDLSKIGLNLSEQDKESIMKFSGRKEEKRMKDIMILGDTGEQNFFHLIYYASLYDPNINVRFAALKRIPKFQENPNFELLIENLHKPGVGDKLDPYFSMMLLNLGRITEEEFNNRLNN